MKPLGELNPPARILLGPGPTNVDSRVYRALLAPILGHLDPDFLKIMEDVQGLLRRVFQTENRLTFPVSGTGSAGMETAMANCLEVGSAAVVTVAGHFGARMAEMARRAGCSQLGQSAPVALMGWSFWNLWVHVGQRYSYSGIADRPQSGECGVPDINRFPFPSLALNLLY